LKTAIIDYGIDILTLSRYRNKTKNLAVSEGKIIAVIPPSELTHGGLCAGVFAEQAGVLPDISICLNKDDSRRSNKNDLVAALSWCSDNDVKLINLSMGTTQYDDAPHLRKVTGELHEKGSVLIAASLLIPPCLIPV